MSRRGATRARRRWYQRVWLWILLAIVLIVAAAAVAGAMLVPKVFAVRDAMEAAIPLASDAQTQILAGDTAASAATVSELSAHVDEAREHTESPLWTMAEVLPVVGANLAAVRQTVAAVDELVTDAVAPATTLSLEALKPRDGRFDLAALQEAGAVVDTAAEAVASARATLDGIDRDGLIGQVTSAVDRLDTMLTKVEPMIGPAQTALQLLPPALGAEGPRNYLFLFQNNAESRGTGGNPAAIVLLHVADGEISIAQQASSDDFNNRRPEPIIPLDPGTEALYGDKIGRYMQDVMLTPDFTESADIMQAFWAESFGTPLDGVVSFDPVALSYLLQATGPVTLTTGDVLTGENAVPILLNEVYARFPDSEMQDAFFAAAAVSIFDVVSSGAGDLDALLAAFTRAIDEGRLMYVPTAAEEAEFIAGTRVSGIPPLDNAEQTMLGVYVNDITEGKLDYYVDLSVAASSDQCQVEGAPTFAATATLTNTLDPAAVAGLATYISPARFFPKGWVTTDLVLYGPVGAEFASATVDGQPVAVTALTHLDRPAVKITVMNQPGQTHTVTAVFTGDADEDYGPLTVQHTPMVRPTEVTIDTPGC